MEGNLCNVCLAGNLSIQSGILVCDVCGSTIEDYIEETQEYQTGLSDSRFFRKHKSSKNIVTVKVTERELPDLAFGLLEYVRALQTLLQKQSRLLIERMSLQGKVLKTVEDIWFACVKFAQVLEPSFQRGIKEQVLRTSTVSTNSKLQDFNVIKSVVERELWKVLPISLTLAICFLSCIYTGEDVDPLDISQLALNGDIPYLGFFDDTFQASKELKKIVSRSFILPNGVPSPSSVYLSSLNIAKNLRLGAYQLNYRSWIKRVVLELQLPEELVARSIVLFDCYNSILKERLRLHPWAELVIYIIVAAKVGYNPSFARKDEHGKAIFDFSNWLKLQEGRLCNPITSNLGRKSDAVGQTLSQFRSYTDYLGCTFANFTSPDGISGIRSALLSLTNCGISLESTSVLQPNGILAIKRLDEEVTASISRNRYFIDKVRKAVPSLASEFAAFVSVVSLRAWVSPFAIIEALRKLEQAVLISENEIVYYSNPKIQSDNNRLYAADDMLQLI